MFKPFYFSSKVLFFILEIRIILFNVGKALPNKPKEILLSPVLRYDPAECWHCEPSWIGGCLLKGENSILIRPEDPPYRK